MAAYIDLVCWFRRIHNIYRIYYLHREAREMSTMVLVDKRNVPISTENLVQGDNCGTKISNK